LVKGQFVKIYQDPMTQLKYEGTGCIVKVERHDSEGANLIVRFRDEPDQTFARFVAFPAEVARGWEEEARVAK